MIMSELYQNLIKVQGALKAPKGQYNSFGKYKYRSCEDILEAVKPLLVQHGLLLTIEDDVIQVGDRIYIKAIATIRQGDNFLQSVAFAREEDTKKGMDSSQVTGAASSYARKYALNGLFCIDDNKDSDSTNIGKQPEKKETEENPLMDVALNDVRNAKDTQSLKAVWEEYTSLHSNKVFKGLVNQRKAELNGAA